MPPYYQSQRGTNGNKTPAVRHETRSHDRLVCGCWLGRVHVLRGTPKYVLIMFRRKPKLVCPAIPIMCIYVRPVYAGMYVGVHRRILCKLLKCLVRMFVCEVCPCVHLCINSRLGIELLMWMLNPGSILAVMLGHRDWLVPFFSLQSCNSCSQRLTVDQWL